MTTAPPSTRAPTFLEEVVLDTLGGDPKLELCLQCGTCGGSCPSGPDMDHTPRALFAMIAADMKNQVLHSNAPWYCVACYYCMVRCPQEIHITDIMYTLKRMAIDEGYFTESEAAVAHGFSETFIDYVDNYGRSFEFGLATRHHLRHHPMSAVKMATGMGLDLFRKGRMDLTPKRIKNIDQLKAILSKSKELGGAT